MIKIKPYTELSNSDEIKRLYMSMVAKSLPFYPEDIFPDGFFIRMARQKSLFLSSRDMRDNAYPHILISSMDSVFRTAITPSQKRKPTRFLRKSSSVNTLATYSPFYMMDPRVKVMLSPKSCIRS